MSPSRHEPEKKFPKPEGSCNTGGLGYAMNGSEVEFLRARARKIERALVRNGWTRVHLAELTGYDERTIRNVLSAKPVRDQTKPTSVKHFASSRSLMKAANTWRSLRQLTASTHAGRTGNTRAAISPIAGASAHPCG
jgi:hypothetical protein